MNKKVVWSILIIFLLLTCGNIVSLMGWENQPKARGGILDLRGWSGFGQEVVSLKGEWEFYPAQLLSGEDDVKVDTAPLMIQAPGNWGKTISKVLYDGTKGYGTYRLQIKLDPNEAGLQAIRVPLIRTAHRLFVDGEQVGAQGVTAGQSANYKAEVKPYIAYQEVHGDRIDIFVQVANFDHATSGGIIQSIRMGPPELIDREQQRNAAMEFGMIVAFGLFAFFFAMLHILARRNGWIYLALFYTLNALMTSIQGSRWLLWIFPHISFRWITSSLFLFSTGIILSWFLFVYDRHEKRMSLPIKRIVLAYSIGACLFLVLFPVDFVTRFLMPWFIVTAAIYVYILYVLLRSLRDGDSQSLYEFWAFFLFSAHALLNFLFVVGFYELSVWYFVQLTGVSLAISALLLVPFFRAYRKTKALSLEMKQADRFKNEFMTGISEQINVPLQAIISIANARLESDDRLTAGQTRDLRLLASIGWYARSLVKDLHDFSRIRERDIMLHVRPIHLYSVMDEVIERVRCLTFNDAITLSNDIAHSLPPVVADEQRLKQILTSLLRAGCTLTGDGAINVQAVAKERQVVEIQIHMAGSHLGEENKMWFVRALKQTHVHSSIHAEANLGLVLVKELVELHNGYIDVDKGADDAASIRLAFPIATDPQHALPGRQEEPAAGGTGLELIDPQSSDHTRIGSRKSEGNRDTEAAKIFLIDSDALNVKVMLALLSLDHYRITVVRDGRRAMQMARQIGQTDLVIVDRTLDGVSGLDICRQLRKQYNLFELPILLLTSPGYPDHALAASEAGANDFLVKPIEASELRVRVHTLLHLKRSVKERIRMELAFLQAQIKPHFLYNTLNSIAALSKRQPDKMADLLADLGHYLRESFRFDNTEPLIPFERELQLIRSYLHIEKVRFEEWLSFDLEVAFHEFLIPPLTIQPLVENAVRHGIMKKENGGHVLLRVLRDGQDVRILVKDDGVGMTPDKLERLLRVSSTGGIGIQNIERRWRQMFGHGISIHSVPGQGTEVELRFSMEMVGLYESHTG